jgi:hypothetical protein
MIKCNQSYLEMMIHNMHFVGEGDVPGQEELEHGRPPALDDVDVVGGQDGLGDQLVEAAVGQQGALEVGELLGDPELLNVGQDLRTKDEFNETFRPIKLHLQHVILRC